MTKATTTRQPVKALNKTAKQVSVNAAAEKARKTASKAALKAQRIDAMADAAIPPFTPIPAPKPKVDHKAQDRANQHAALRIDAMAELGEDADDAEIAEYIAEQMGDDIDDIDLDMSRLNYVGPMLALRRASDAGRYRKAVNGQPCCMDVVALALGSLTPDRVIFACINALCLPSNPYFHLNIGQQSMNLRNKVRGAMKRGELEISAVLASVESQTLAIA